MLLTRRQTDKQAKDQNITFRPPVVTVTVEDRKRHRPTTKYNKKNCKHYKKMHQSAPHYPVHCTKCARQLNMCCLIVAKPGY